MKLRPVFITIIGLMTLTIIFLSLNLLLRHPQEKHLDFNTSLAYAELRMSRFPVIELNYTVNLTVGDVVVTGTIIFKRANQTVSVTMSDNLIPYKNSILVYDPLNLFYESFNNSFTEFMGPYNYTKITPSMVCISLRFSPAITDKQLLVQGDVMIVTNLDIMTGYPVQSFIIERNEEGEMAYSEIFLTGINY